MIIVLIILIIALIFCITLIVLLKKDIGNINKELNIIKEITTNKKLITKTFDKDICNLVITINEFLEIQRETILNNEKASREFKQAITNISHDLRTPLTSTIGYIQLLKSQNLSDIKKEEYYFIIENKLKYLSNLMNNLFEYTQIIEGKNKIKMEKINICNVLRDIISLNYDSFVSKGFDVKINIPDKPIYYLCDLYSIKRVVQNLIQNVIIHGIEYFELNVENNSITFKNKVSDINSINVEKLFNRFYTANLSRNVKTTGLGLAISKELIINMNGKIKAFIQNDILCIYIEFITNTN